MGIKTANIDISKKIYDFINTELVDKISLDRGKFWQDFAKVLKKLTNKNIELLKTRSVIQKKLDNWHINNKQFSKDEYISFLKEIGYIDKIPKDFTIRVENPDQEITTISGPQLVVPISNARYAINAVNARWGSLYDAMYGTDFIDNVKYKKVDNKRNIAVFNKALDFLDEAVAIKNAKWQDVTTIEVVENSLQFILDNNHKTRLIDNNKFIAHSKSNNLTVILLKNNDLHIELQVDKTHAIGGEHKAGIKDIMLESAITTIADMEDSVSAVNVNDKVNNYKNLLGLIKKDLETKVIKANKEFTRKLAKPRNYIDKNGNKLTLTGLSLILIRNVGHHMFTDAILQDGKEIPEGILDALVCGLIARYKLLQLKESSNLYIVKPKMHGMQEAMFATEVFDSIEKMLDLEVNSLKIGVMDEERRTSYNLKAVIHATKERIFFVNTGFLDRSGDEIRTSMFAGPMLPKEEMKQHSWLKTYEDNNVKNALICGFINKAQIGKGMWAMPDMVLEMFNKKIIHPQSGANCAWVPSPTTATIHAMHYHKVNVVSLQQKLIKSLTVKLDKMLNLPLLDRVLDKDDIQKELDNNIQGILGYVVHWVNAGIGCSKVADINNVGLMEDRATLRISSLHVANWLLHNICSKHQVEKTFKRMAKIVDTQNQNVVNYEKLSNNYSCPAFLAAKTLVFAALEQENGYTELVLSKYRRIKLT